MIILLRNLTNVYLEKLQTFFSKINLSGFLISKIICI